MLSVDPHAPEVEWSSALDEAVAVLRGGGLVAFPTETVYGLGGRALDPAAALRIFAAKGRPQTHPLIVHVEGEADARPLASHWSARAARLARAFWPGPLTLVVPRGSRIPAVVAGGGDSIALRAPAHPVALALLRRLGEPIAAPSANRYQSISPTLAAHVVKSLGDAVSLVLDGGPCEAGIESTVVDVLGEATVPPRVLRPGALGIAALRAIEPEIEASDAVLAEDASRASPGMDARHYAPRARLVIALTREEAVTQAGARVGEGERVGLVVRGPVTAGGTGLDVRVLPDEPAAFAAALFATLHALDDAGAKSIVVEAVPAAEAWWAVADRLKRASA